MKMADYIVKKGDTLSAIAKKYGTTYQEIAKSNKIANPNKIYVGQKLTIGGSSNTSASTKPASKPANTQTNTPATTTNNPTFKGVDQKYVDKAYEEYKPSEKEIEYGTKRDEYVKSAEDKINAGFQPSETVTQAFDYVNGQLEYFQNGKTSWDDKINSQIGKIENREKFVYDVDNDPLFQQALASAMNSGKTAMEDTIGQASTLTGGYGSTYATTAGNQAYNSFIEDAYNNLPQYYQMALSAYEAEGQEMYNLLGIYTQMGEQEWGRHVDAFNTTLDFANSERDFEYGVYQDDITNLTGLAGTYDSMYQGEQTKNLTLWQQSIDNAWKTIGQQSGDYWSQTELDYKKERDAISDEQWQQSFGLQQKQYKLSTGDTDGDGVLSDAEKAEMNTTYSYDADGNVVKGNNVDSNTTYVKGQDGKLLSVNVDDIPSDVSKKAATYKDDDDGLISYLDGQVELGNITEAESYYLYDYYSTSSNADESTTTPTNKGMVNKDGTAQFRTTKGDNFDVTVSDNSFVTTGDKSYRVENKGKVDDSDTIDKLNKVGVTDGEVFLYNGEAYVKYAGGYFKVGATNRLFNMGETDGYQNLLKALQTSSN